MSSQENFEAYICGIDSNEFTEESSSVLCPISSQSYCPESCVKEELEITDDEDESLPSNYLNKNLFRLLIPALEETLIEASKWKALRVQKCRFNGVDHIAQILWNQNPRRSKVYSPPLDFFEIPVFKEYLRLHPRPNYPKSWLWTDEEAALHIQRYVRGWLVRKQAEVQEMRQFWKVEISIYKTSYLLICSIIDYQLHL
ncbi:IQ domain-containing protein K-like [Ceratina calcarata]|uniref:IQ domain-containing protein K-like n=1 Tax=Ceratina calcarata TaxID=156304 RepID=A0AAJ7N9L6_9HYME|nr:IQ domain-containing protein K-like [Ceratina calcarata]